jgi:predicted AAA+ superfamily ATPase
MDHYNGSMKIKRAIESTVRDLATQYRIVTITGPRQSGKTTLCKMAFPGLPYVSLENPDVRDAATADPVSFLNRHRATGVVLDEIQNLPQILSYIQGIVDEDEQAGQFILTGSHQFSLMEGISQSLAGRTALVRLLPFSIAESQMIEKIDHLEEYLFRGFYPGVWSQSLEPTGYYRDYFETYVQRDVRQMLQVKDLRLFRNFVRLCAGRVGQCFNASDIGNNLGVSSHTVKSWLSVLEASYIIYLMEPFSSNTGKRMVKSPKLYFYDVGLASYLLGLSSPDRIFPDRMRGPLFENMVIVELLKDRYNHNMEANLCFYRDRKQHEVDVLLMHGSRFDCVEIKSSATFTPGFLKGIDYLKRTAPDSIARSYLRYAGKMDGTIQETELLNYRQIEETMPARSH